MTIMPRMVGYKDGQKVAMSVPRSWKLRLAGTVRMGIRATAPEKWSAISHARTVVTQSAIQCAWQHEQYEMNEPRHRSAMLKRYPRSPHKKQSRLRGMKRITTILTSILLLCLSMPVTAWNKVFEAELTTGASGRYFGYSKQHASPYGSLTQTLEDTSPVTASGDLDGILFLDYDYNHVYLGLPDSTPNADSLFETMAVSYEDSVITFVREEGRHTRTVINGEYVQQWRWQGHDNPAPKSSGANIWIEFSRPAPVFGGNYKATVTSTGLSGTGAGYENMFGTERGNIVVTDPDPGETEKNADNFNINEHIGAIKGISRNGRYVFLYLDEGTNPTGKNSDKVFTTMRISQDLSTAQDGSEMHYWDFKREEAEFSPVYSAVRFRWEQKTSSIPSSGEIFTIELKDDTPTLACRWRPIWSDCLAAGGNCPLPGQSTVLLGRNEQCMGWEDLSQDPRCLTTAPPVNPALSPRSCAQCQMISADRGKNIGCFHLPEHNDDQLGVLGFLKY